MASTIAHQSDLSNFSLSFDEVGDTEFRLRLGHAWVVSSRNYFAEVFFPHVPSFLSTHHEVLDHRPSGCSGLVFCHLFVSATLRHAECGPWSCCCFQSCFMFLTFILFFEFVTCDVGYLVLTQSHSVDVSCWSALMVPS